MRFKQIPLDQLVVNPDNDRHGHRADEQEAVDWLFANHGNYMMNLIEDIADSGEVFDPPLVVYAENKYIVFDGNRRITALKALSGLVKVPTSFNAMLSQFQNNFRPSPTYFVGCQVDDRPEIVDLILSRRHNGTDAGRGQLSWDPRAKANNAHRTGGTQYYEISAAIEKYLEGIGYKPEKKFKRSTIYRLLNTKARQARFGIKLGSKGDLIFTRPEPEARAALIKVVDDTMNDKLTLNNLLNLESINSYLDGISDFIEPVDRRTSEVNSSQDLKIDQVAAVKKIRPPKLRETLIPNHLTYSENWKGKGTGKIESIWYELQFKLKLDAHPIAIAIMLRALIETATFFALAELKLSRGSKLTGNINSVVDKLVEKRHLDEKSGADIKRFVQDDQSNRSLNALHRVVHSLNFTLGKDDLCGIWNEIEPFLTAALQIKIENSVTIT